MKFIIIILMMSSPSFACKPQVFSAKDEVCENCAHDLGKCMAEAIEKSSVLTEDEARQLRNDCQNQMKVCVIKNNCLNKE